jgi:hypothetical protein
MTRRADVPAPEALRGQRIVADPPVIDAIGAALPASTVLLRFAADEAFLVGGGLTDLRVDGIVEDEVGFVALTVERDVVERHTEWPLPTDVGSFAQGSIAGVPAKLSWLPDGRAWIVTHAAYAAELLDRLT